MKFFRLFGVAVTTLCMCVNFSACSNGDDAGSGDFTGERKLVKMVMTDGDNTETYKFSYDNQGRVTEIKIGDEYGVWSRIFHWEDNTVKVMQDGGEHRCTYIIENGLVRREHDPNAPADQANSYFLYNIEDRLTQISAYTDTEVTWEGDKLISYVGPYDFFPTYTYDNITCKKGYHPLLGLTDFAYTNPELGGMKTNQLPVSCTNVFNGTYPEYNYTVTYEYEFNAEGYISKIIVKRVGGYHDGVIISWTLTWE